MPRDNNYYIVLKKALVGALEVLEKPLVTRWGKRWKSVGIYPLNGKALVYVFLWEVTYYCTFRIRCNSTAAIYLRFVRSSSTHVSLQLGSSLKDNRSQKLLVITHSKYYTSTCNTRLLKPITVFLLDPGHQELYSAI